ncbi:hypothetical protein EVJ58_g1330 [Rhodofomes roseus]|uniref:DUF952 domain-containing protein n=1 Tax=Rhodofomes roseus TaxID=34475 RepID=A0A4Y9Z066_9APHY|nr:hypothetical protein EVJ58_g1330 [Rhodofomes roseus]
MATTGDAKPTYIYKLIPSSAPPPDHPLPAVLPVSELDQSSGFIHLSTSKQVPNTLKFFFADELRVHVLRLAYDPLEEEKLIRWEDPKAEVCGPRGGEGMFPHLYNGLKLGKDEVDSVATWERREGEGWEDVTGREQSWLIY